MNFLKKEISDIIQNCYVKQMSNFDILEGVFQQKNQDFNIIYQYLNNNKDSIDNFTSALTYGYEIDEFDIISSLGLSTHPYLLPLNESKPHLPRFNTTFMIFYYQHDDFYGNLWIPYASKYNYVVNYDFSFDFEKGKRDYTPNRYGEIHLAPKWFQELYYAIDKYVNDRNAEIMERVKDKFNILADRFETESQNYQTFTEYDNNKAFNEMIKMGYPIIPFVLERIQSHPSYLYLVLNSITYRDVDKLESSHLDSNLEEQVLSWLNWGKEKKYIK